MRLLTYESLTQVDKSLLTDAGIAMERAYNPYSGFYVGAAILSKEGLVVTGSNVENAAYGSTLCAERAAIVRANAQGIRMFQKIAIVARGERFDTKEVTAPCGSCRQMLYESSQISDLDLEVLMATTRKDKIVIATIGELLPLAFGPKDMGIDLTRFRE